MEKLTFSLKLFLYSYIMLLSFYWVDHIWIFFFGGISEGSGKSRNPGLSNRQYGCRLEIMTWILRHVLFTNFIIDGDGGGGLRFSPSVTPADQQKPGLGRVKS